MIYPYPKISLRQFDYIFSILREKLLSIVGTPNLFVDWTYINYKLIWDEIIIVHNHCIIRIKLKSDTLVEPIRIESMYITVQWNYVNKDKFYERRYSIFDISFVDNIYEEILINI